MEQLCAGSSLSSFEICRSLWAFRVMGIVERTTEPAAISALDDDGLGLMLPQD